MQEAKQLLIQQKLELQGQIEAAQRSLEEEKKEHQATRDGRQQREEQLLAQNKEVQDKLVRPSVITVTLNDLNRVRSVLSLVLLDSPNTGHDVTDVFFRSWLRREPGRSR